MSARYDRNAALERIAAAVADAFRRVDNPGVSDLDNEQPMSVHLPLGVLRAALAAQSTRPTEDGGEGENHGR